MTPKSSSTYGSLTIDSITSTNPGMGIQVTMGVRLDSVELPDPAVCVWTTTPRVTDVREQGSSNNLLTNPVVMTADDTVTARWLATVVVNDASGNLGQGDTIVVKAEWNYQCGPAVTDASDTETVPAPT